MSQPAHLPYSGIATFARAPIAPPEGDWRADVGVLGIPFDIALGFRPGARYAPRALREASLRYVPPFTDLSGRTRLEGVTFADAGDVVLPSLEPELARERMTAAARHLRERCRVPVFLGGDHSVSFPLLRAFADVPDLHVVQLDAHLDFTDERNGTRFSNSSPFRRAVEALPNLVHITTVGLRGLRFDPEAVRAARERGHTLIPMPEVTADLAGVLEALPSGKNVYLSVDADAFDPAVLPGTSSPEPDGLTYAQAMALIRAAARRNTVVGLDLVELAPNLDPSGRSALIGARLVMETLCEVFHA
ncbi:agmatinase (plasmid) [Deinococcus metallilatus]|uniref:Agmatinase n=1 Tax=Deinococcus metallilatus TaxID=1211322 RepID=A0AAJ5F7P8_9DEIO|nr:arginase family protein [Deinococcus metallilatus]MBB5293284.1 agmatinase [Deinococcus metallilatus]QBY06396.1 agmatinase [Deinococcus metallilatus]RXJ18075.1 agmatinase [Deinococcus metallilatus]TLK32011.1 agmatinase [Deinococcus metallilatus]GMA15493.1 agmatinase [Deinococcus metallilatus]